MVVRVAIADDHHLVRAGVASLLSSIDDVVVCGEASDGEQVCRLVVQENPDILFLDLSMPGMSGLDALAYLNNQKIQTKVIILSMHDSPEHVHRVLRLGAVGYMLKDVLPDELERAIRAVMRGDRWLSTGISKTVIDGFLGRPQQHIPTSALSDRQAQVLKMIADGRSTKQIGIDLNLSVKTIETYRAQIMTKLDIHDVAGLVRYAVRQGIIPL